MTSPNKLIRTEGFRLDQIYTSEKARDEDSQGRVRSGEMSYSEEQGKRWISLPVMKRLPHSLCLAQLSTHKQDNSIKSDQTKIICPPPGERVLFQ